MANPNDRRRKIEEIKRKQRSSDQRGTILTIVLALVVAASLITVAVLTKANRSGKERGELAAIGLAAADAGCGDVKEEDPKGGSANHVQTTVQYPNPPANGPHHPTWATPPRAHFWARGESQPPEMIVHNLEHGYVVVWYDADTPEDQIQLLKDVGETEKSRKFIIAPWDRGKFEGDNDIAITAWARMRLCKQVSGAAIAEFIRDYQGNGPKSVAPEPQGL